MNNNLIKICGSAVLLATVGLSSLVQAQDLQAVLTQARSAREAEVALYKKRAEEYNKMSDAEKQRAMAQARESRAAIQQQVDAKNRRYSDNDLELSKLNTQLRDLGRKTQMSEIFGSARQVAADTATKLKQSLVSAQYSSDNRVQFLTDLSASDKVLNAAQLERLWFEIQREMTADGEVVTYKGNITQASGAPLTTDVTRIGPFTAVADGKFLSYVPNLSQLTMLRRQPDALLSEAKDLQSASSGYVTTVVDSTRGVLINMVVERPTFVERVTHGEVGINFTILAVGAAGAIPFIFQLLYLLMARMGVSAQMRNLSQPKKDNALGRVLLAFKSGSSIDEGAEIAELRISEAVMREVPKLERFQPLLRLVVAAGPLLGLIGTVVGMILTFQSITETGSSDPKLMANGIGTAMIATLLGLGIAVPMLFANALLSSLSRSIVQILDEQSTGILAENIEKRKNA